MSNDYPRPPQEVITSQRLRKRVAKLTKQRDHFKAEHDKLLAALEKLPVFSNSMDRMKEARLIEAKQKELKTRCDEQALLIQHLTKAPK